jgi:hypothetical protein
VTVKRAEVSHDIHFINLIKMILMWQGQMPPAEWTIPDQKAYLESKYNDFLKAQAGSSVTQFWGPVFSEWFRRFPEELAIFGEAPEVLSEEQKEAKGTAVDLRQKVSLSFHENKLDALTIS